MKTLAALTIGTGLLASSAFGAVSFNLYVDAIAESDGSTLISDEGLLVLVVDTGSDGFSLPSAGSLVNGNDEIVTYWDLAEEGVGDAYISLASDLVEWQAGWTEGSDLALFWFPDLSKDNMTPTADTAYGVFSDAAGLTSGDGWELPSDGEIMHRLAMFTTAATKFSSLASLPADVGVTSYAVSNPPSTTAPSVPSVDVVNGGGKSTLTWTSTGTTGGYIVQRKKGDGAWETIGFASAGTTSYEDTDVKPGREYDYRLYSVGAFAVALQDELPVITSERSIFANISSRASVNNDDGIRAYELLNVGAQLQGNDPTKRIMALGFGPYNNEKNDRTTWVSDTFLEYEFGGDIIAYNDNWMQDPENAGQVDPDAEAILATMGAVGAPVFFQDDPDNNYVSRDSAILEDVPVNTPVLFRATSLDDSGFIAVGLFDGEYEAPIHDNRIVNLSTRGYLEEDGIFNGGVIITGTVPKEVLVVAAGPYLRDGRGANANFVLQNPQLRVQRTAVPGNPIILYNDQWDVQDGVADPDNGLLAVETDMDRLTAVLEAKNFDTTHMSLDAAALLTLEPGNYLFRVFAEDDGTSRPDGFAQIALWEIEMD
ncbi:fibronectin type III domain-containing protein [Pelagicoccus sp. SDUM812003]|uniref:fibronectin type III domain-containing protein n=1 Tax=Pelagicoccus sp. SDUM812003 TaxID=3041267 RepID=UPI00280FDF6E|nr:fibronectin type III domain-containing protein [Pelagicoccus sp. SDUM812003]MDQ8202507.1 fibronectin type III domain-containing protein [Pelagicoccus sp. SDUM812003]